jgi:hypothetical protein
MLQNEDIIEQSITVFYLVKITVGELSEPKQFAGQDSTGALWIGWKLNN